MKGLFHGECNVPLTPGPLHHCFVHGLVPPHLVEWYDEGEPTTRQWVGRGIKGGSERWQPIVDLLDKARLAAAGIHLVVIREPTTVPEIEWKRQPPPRTPVVTVQRTESQSSVYGTIWIERELPLAVGAISKAKVATICHGMPGEFWHVESAMDSPTDEEVFLMISEVGARARKIENI